METHRIAATAATLLTLAGAQAQEVFMTLSVDKRFYQRSGFRLDFAAGQLNLLLSDGQVYLDGACVIDPQPFFFGPSQLPPCPLGATGFVAQGDVDRDGIRDDNQYWSVVGVVPAFLVEPSRPDLVQLFSAPPSKLPRPLSNFRDDSIVTFYNVSTPAVTQYDWSRYELTLPYGSNSQVETAVVQALIQTGGFLNVVVTGVDIAGSPLVVQVPVLPGDFGGELAVKIREALEDVPAITDFYAVGGIGANVVLTELEPNGNDPTLSIVVEAGTATGFGLPTPISLNTVTGAVASPAATAKRMREELVNGQYIFNFPRLNNPELTPVAIPVTLTPMVEALDGASRSKDGFRFTSGTWDGEYYQLDPRLINLITWTGNNRSNIRPNDRMFFSILSAAEDTIIFPPTVPLTRVLLSDATVQEYTLPPFFFDVGVEGVMSVDCQRFLPSNGVAFDTSSRQFRANVRMVDSYAGFAQITFPVGSTKDALKPASDVDRDGMSNIDEFAFEWPTRELLIAEGFAPEGLGFGTPAANNSLIKPALPVVALDEFNHIVVKASRRSLTGTSLRYVFALLDTTKKNPKYRAIKPGSQWTITETQEIEQFGPGLVELPRDYITLRSVNPVANPADPLPAIRVLVTPITLK
jgi:hypothetical protein